MNSLKGMTRANAARSPGSRLSRRGRKFFRPIVALVSLCLIVTGFGPAPAAQAAVGVPGPLTQYVNNFVGTLNNGNTYPGAAMPFGMVQFSPDNGHGQGYAYNNTNLRGFGMIHLSGVGCGLGGIMPQFARVGTPTSTTWSNSGYYVPFTTPLHSAENEEASPGYYRVRTGSGANIVQSELTATTRTGVARYTFPASAGTNARVLINSGYSLSSTMVTSSAEIIDNRTVLTQSTLSGFCQGTEPFTVYAKTVFNRPFDLTTSTTWAGGTIPSTVTSSSTAQRTGAMLTFDVTNDQVVVAQTSLSYVDASGAAQNFAIENVNGDFDKAKDAADAEWESRLSTIKIDSTNTDQIRSFYSALYRSFLAPNVSEDVDGRYRGFGEGYDTIHNINDSDAKLTHYYQNFSLWDTYRTQEQFLALVFPKEASDQVKSLVLHGEQGGWAPRWTYGPVETNIMTGDPVTVFLASAYDQGLLEGGWGERAYQMLKPSLDGIPPDTTPYNGRQGNPDYIPYGVVPLWTAAPRKAGDWDYDHGPSSTLEYTLADGMVARMAADLGHTADAERYAQRGQNYKAMWDPEFNFYHSYSGLTVEGAFNARTRTGAFWPTNSLVTQEARFHEGTEPQYEFLATHDMPGVIAMMGGREKAIQRLDNMFRYEELVADPEQTATCGWVGSCTGGSMTYYGYGYYNPNNEPDINNPFAYTWLGQPWKTADIVDATKYLYRPIPEGMTGNDDLGTMSGWQVLTSIGLFPLAPGADYWGITTPAFSAVDITLDKSFYPNSSGKLEIRANGRTDNVHYIQSMQFNGQPYNKAYLTGDQLLAGAGTLTYEIGGTPSTWATSADANPGTIAPLPSSYADRVSLNTVGNVAAEPGQTVTAYPDLLVQGTGEVQVTMTKVADLPFEVSGLTPTTTAPANGELMHFRPAVTIKVPAGTPSGVYPVATIDAWGQTQVAVKVAVGIDAWQASVSTAKSIAPAGTGAADVDGAGHYLLDSSLKAAGVGPGVASTVTISGQTLTFTIPDGPNDTILAAGQTIDVEAGLAGATTVAFIGLATTSTTSAVNINPTITFSDGTTATMGNRAFYGWASTSTTNRLVSLRERGAGTAVEAVGARLGYTAAYSVPAGRSIKSITMPTSASVRILAIASNATSATPVLTSAPTVQGVLNIGETLTGTPATWDVTDVTTTYQWYRDGYSIPGATNLSYTIVEQDLGAKLSLGIIGAKDGYQTAYVTSDELAIPARPVPTTAPSILGTPKVGQTLAVDPGVWDAKNLAFTYQWLLDGSAILGATDASYVVRSTDVGKAISVRVVASRSDLPSGTAVASPVTVTLTFVATTPPTITGTAKAGSTLYAWPGTWEPQPSAFTYQWLRDGLPISGATGSSYTLVNADAGTKISVSVTGSRTDYASVTETSASVTASTELATIKVTQAPSIAGVAKVGNTLDAAPGVWWPSTVSVAYQWQRDGAAISGATGSSYTLTSADAGAKITVAVTGSASGYASVTKTSGAVTVPVPAQQVIKVTQAPSIAGVAKVGNTLDAAPGVWWPSTVSVAYQWQRDGAAISGATKSSYDVVAADAGKKLTVAVTGSASGYASVTKTSGAVTVEKVAPVPPKPATVTKLKLNQSQLRLVKGKTLTIEEGLYYTDSKASYSGKVTWKSSNKKVATVSSSGKITAKKAGSATITATTTQLSASGKKLSVSVKVTVVNKKPKSKVTKVSASVPKTMKAGKTAYITGKYSSSKATGVKVTYGTSNASVLTVDKAGRIVAKAKGTGYVLVKAGGKTAKYKVTVS